MEEKYFSVELAARILGCHVRSVQRLIQEGWLDRPGGGLGSNQVGRVTQKSLYQFMIVDRLSRLPARTLRELKKHRENFGRFPRQNEEANRFFIYEGTDKVDGALSPVDPSAEENIDTRRRAPTTELKRCLHHEFAEQHQFSFGMRARQLAPDDPSLQDDLVQVMSLAVLEYDKPADFDFLFELAVNRAKDYIKYEARRGMRPLNAARHARDQLAEKISSLTTFIDELLERGVPVEWIEEVIGMRVETA